ncbi:hypothetical protein GUITHDRAFT_164178 [Guillardia theta CCMP2712]|uniref:Cytochrome c domain-containing protein n=1 Tax=Guillardia theta (strain CCMP2712) TaxID=905079 RepID=L1J1X8_GUITC|nr:hypothetical protein GUITHDRAFT_164178 [Guillardia theta CCMP2712]EKX42144.1 hypothetical protein GUITHDRAFT_164178 [Guillardia theta CCMP2712]|eukprot:XP_005829124.1 hypothetical protein GUITHDRAFT_164178 [Guillardia theta CCMP2712]
MLRVPRIFGKVAVGATVGGAAYIFTSSTAYASDQLHSAAYPWSHSGFMAAYDAASIRRGHQVYQQVCAACHGLKRIAYRNLVGVCYTEDEAKEMAAEKEYTDGPDDTGAYFERPGKLSDYIQSPYKNENEARYANNGGLPPDLSLITKARHGGADYIFALLTGYRDPPAGVVIAEGQHWNPYFPGGRIQMPPPIYDGGVEYEDGTEATASQMAKDVTTFLAWAAEPEADERKKMGLKFIAGLALCGAAAGWYKRFLWSIYKSRRISFH